VLTGIGLGLGGLAAAALSRSLASFLFGVSAGDPATFLVVALTFTVVAATAAWVPARRAARVDPMVALRAE
jgi:ABC-type antimicrobial peptide transport system permease subunit